MSNVIKNIVRSVHGLPQDFKDDLLQKLEDKNLDNADALSETITWNYDRLNEEVRNELLLKLAEYKESALGLVQVITGNYERLNAEVRNELLLKLAEYKEARGALGWAAALDLHNLPDNIRNTIIEELAKDENLSWTLASGIVNNYYKLPSTVTKLLLDLTTHDLAASSLTSFMAGNYGSLPEQVRNDLLQRLAENNYVASELYGVINRNSNSIPENLRSELLKKVISIESTGQKDLTQSDKPHQDSLMGMIPGQYFLAPDPMYINANRKTVKIRVKNTGDRPCQIGSHTHFFEVNKALEFHRIKAYGYRLNIPAGTGVRFEPGDEKEVDLCEIGGARIVYGFNGLTMGGLDSHATKAAAFERAKTKGFKGI